MIAAFIDIFAGMNGAPSSYAKRSRLIPKIGTPRKPWKRFAYLNKIE
jgi:hypothetical protein